MYMRSMLLLLLLVSTAVIADEMPVQGQWTGKGQVGYVASQGNTESESITAALDTSLLADAWKHALHLGGLYGKNKSIVSAERWDALWQSNYNFSPDMFTFGALRYANDMFGGFAYQAAVTAGLGYKFVHTESMQVDAQLGAGYRQSRPQDLVKDEDTGAVIARILHPRTNEVIFSAGLNYAQQLTSTTGISNKLLIESGSSNTLVTDAFSLNVKMTDRLALGVGLNYQYNSRPPEPLKKVDTTETMNIVYSF